MDMHPRDEAKPRLSTTASQRRASGTFRSPSRTPGRRARSYSDEHRKDAEGDVTSSEEEDLGVVQLLPVPEEAVLGRPARMESTTPSSKAMSSFNASATRTRSVSLATERPQPRQLNFDDAVDLDESSSSGSEFVPLSSSIISQLPMTTSAAWGASFPHFMSPRPPPASTNRPPLWAQDLFDTINNLKQDLGPSWAS